MIPQQKILRIFKLINLLKKPGGKTVAELSKILETSTRSVQRYLNLLEEIGLMIDKDFNNRYFLCTFDDQEKDYLQFTGEESIFLNQLLLSTSPNHPLALSLQKKVYVHGELYTLPEYLEKSRLVRYLSHLQKAIDQRKQVLIKNYHSAHSQEIGDRLVEPFAFDAKYTVIQAYEPASEKNKFFKLERIGDVVIVNKAQQHASKHKAQHTDCFGYTGENDYHVQLQMSLRAFLLLREEYPGALAYLQMDKENDFYLFDGPIHQLEGIGRFVMGFLDEIRIISPDQLKQYIEQKIEKWMLRQKLSHDKIKFDAIK